LFKGVIAPALVPLDLGLGAIGGKGFCICRMEWAGVKARCFEMGGSGSWFGAVESRHLVSFSL
jgi:hypothetical protein